MIQQERGLMGFGQGQAYQRLDLDDMYEKAQKAGMLNSVSIFGGGSLPWTKERKSSTCVGSKEGISSRIGTNEGKLVQTSGHSEGD